MLHQGLQLLGDGTFPPRKIPPTRKMLALEVENFRQYDNDDMHRLFRCAWVTSHLRCRVAQGRTATGQLRFRESPGKDPFISPLRKVMGDHNTVHYFGTKMKPQQRNGCRITLCIPPTLLDECMSSCSMSLFISLNGLDNHTTDIQNECRDRTESHIPLRGS